MEHRQLIKLLKRNKKVSLTIYGVCGWFLHRYFTTLEDALNYYNSIKEIYIKSDSINLVSFNTKYVNEFDFEIKGLSIIK